MQSPFKNSQGRLTSASEGAMKNTYDEVYSRWLKDPENFWAEAAEAVHWDKKWDRVLAGQGVQKGDRVIIYMPMVPETVVAMLACARIGAIHSVVFGGFAAHELATRIDDAKPRVILSASCGIEVNRIIPYKPLLDAAIAEAQAKPEDCVILQRPMCRAEF